MLRFPKFFRPFVLLLAILIPASVMAAPVRVAILPFQIHADKDYGFLQKGIVDMLSSRLALPGRTEIIDPLATAQALESIQGFSGDNLALMAAAKLQADRVLHGSITLLGESVSIDAKMLDATGTSPPYTFFKQTQNMSEVIGQINLLATEVNAQVFNRAPAVADVPGTTTPPADQNDLRTHPEKLLQKESLFESGRAPLAEEEEGGASALNPGFVRPAGEGKGPAFWKSRNFQFVITGVAVGDVDNDGQQETVIVTPDSVLIVRFVQGQMQELKKISSGRFSYNIAVDIADINANGTPEIFVSAMNNGRNQVNSTVYEFSGKDFIPIVEKTRWYFRVIRHPARGNVLLGQRQLSGSDPFSEEIVELEWKHNEYQAAARILPGGRFNVLGVTLGDVMNDRNETALGMNDFDKLRLSELNGKEVWTSADPYGGSPLFVTLQVSDKGSPADKAYLPTRILLADVDGDGKYEAIVARNDEVTGRKLANQRIYRNGQIIALQWNGLGMSEIWHTRRVSGHVQDIALGDFDNDGKDEILCGMVLKEGALIGTEEKSTLIAYEIQK